MIKLHSIDEFERVLEKENALLVLKHSITCPISLAAYDEYEAFTKEQQEVPTYYLTVQESRPLSNYIAETFQIKHESPQAILFSNKEPVWHASHRKITVTTLTESIN
ncbi:bacillithiol system redox-active protein YtxJ [Bacillus tuaregi]|uniref:bacillithiol system redox-active protein YtxJ n=1 Tax=Bacillus tuaregi TaxID=1816695 RepID=UPI0008F88372|nr:bacillithiol system redox-active protein YtxJ [Bacillus tuaregi]